MIDQFKNKYFTIKYWLYNYWNPYEYYRLPAANKIKQQYKDLYLSVGEVFGGYKIYDAKGDIKYCYSPSIDYREPWELLEAQKLKEIEVTLQELCVRCTLGKYININLEFFKHEAINSFREEINKKGWDTLFIRDGIIAELYKEYRCYWKQWQKWINWYFCMQITDPKEKINYAIEYRIRIGGYDSAKFR